MLKYKPHCTLVAICVPNTWWWVSGNWTHNSGVMFVVRGQQVTQDPLKGLIKTRHVPSTRYFYIFNKTFFMYRYKNKMCFCTQGLSWSWSYDSWIYNYLCNQRLLSLKLFMARCTRYNIMWSSLSVTGRWLSMARCTLYNIMWSSLSVTGRWFSPGIQVSYTNRTDPHYRTENMLKVA